MGETTGIRRSDLREGMILRRDGWVFSIHRSMGGQVYYAKRPPRKRKFYLQRMPIGRFVRQYNAGAGKESERA